MITSFPTFDYLELELVLKEDYKARPYCNKNKYYYKFIDAHS